MALKGDLASVDLAQVFQMLALNQKVGVLGIQAPKAWKSLYFDQRGVTLCFNEHHMLDRVLAQLVRIGRLTGEVVEEARDHAAQMGQSVVDSLLAGGFLTEHDIDRCVRAELEEDVYDIFFWKDARFEFYEGATAVEGQEHETVAERFFFSTDMLIMEAARRIDEWSYIRQRVPDALQVYRQVEGGANVVDLEGDAMTALELVDGKRNVARLIDITGMAKFHLFKALATLIDSSHIEDVNSQDLLPSAKDCFHEGRIQDAINLFEKSVSDGVGGPEAHILCSEAYEAIGEHELAAYHIKCVAEYRAEEGKLKEAVDLLQQVLEKIPTDLRAWERVVEISAGHPELKSENFDPLSAGKRLVDLYLEIGELDRVRSILEGLLRSHPEDVELKKSLINVHTKAGDTKRVVELYESIADDLVENRDPISAVKFLQKILMLDRSRKDISEKIKRLYQMDERRRSRRRSMAALGVLLVLLVLAAVGYVFYDQQARSYYETIDLTSLKESNDYEGAIRVLDAFLSKYPFTIIGQQVEAEKLSFETELKKHKAELDRLQIERDNKIRKIRNQYKIQWDLHNEEFRAGNLASALRALDSCRKLVEEANQPEDHRWSLRVKLPKAYKELRSYLGQAAALERQARRAHDANDWLEERKHTLELIGKYELTAAARRARVPVMVVTRPKGAKIYLADGTKLQATTPAVVYCPNKPEVVLTLELDGFAPKQASVTPRDSRAVAFVMTARPDLTVKFHRPAQTSVAVRGSRIAVGLQGGEVGIAWLDGTTKFQSKLEGLSDVVGVPKATNDLAIFQTNEGHVRAHRLTDGKRIWTTQPRFPLAFDPVVNTGRVFLVDTEGRLFSLRTSTGRELWVRALGGRAAGRPVQKGRKIMVGLQTGGVRIIDAANGDVLRSFKSLGVTTPVLHANRLLIFGTDDGRVRAIRDDNGKQEWVWNAGRAVRPNEICLSSDERRVFVMAQDETLVGLRINDGIEFAKQALPDHVRFGLLFVHGRICTVVRDRIDPERKLYRDRFMAFDQKNLRQQWEFRDLGNKKFKGAPTTDGRYLYVVGSSGEIYRFK